MSVSTFLENLVHDIDLFTKDSGFVAKKGKKPKRISKSAKNKTILNRFFSRIIADGATLQGNQIIYDSLDEVNKFIKKLLEFDTEDISLGIFRFAFSQISNSGDSEQKEELEKKQKAMAKRVENSKKAAKEAKKLDAKAKKDAKAAKSKAVTVAAAIVQEIEEKQGAVIALEEEVEVLEGEAVDAEQNLVSNSEVTMSNITPNEDKITPLEEKSDDLQVEALEKSPDKAAVEMLSNAKGEIALTITPLDETPLLAVGRADNVQINIENLQPPIRVALDAPIIEEKQEEVKETSITPLGDALRVTELRLLLELESITDNLLSDNPTPITRQRFEGLVNKMLNLKKKTKNPSDIQRKINESLKRLRRLSLVELRAIVDGLNVVRSADVQISVLTERRNALEDAIARFKNNPIANDGLTDSETPVAADAILIEEAVKELIDEVESDGVNNSTISNFVRLYDILSFDTQNLVRASITNVIESPLSAGSEALSIPGRLLSRLIIRFIYHNMNITGIDADTEDLVHTGAIEDLSTGGQLMNRNRSVVDKLKDAFKFVIPQPEDVPVRTPVSRVNKLLKKLFPVDTPINADIDLNSLMLLGDDNIEFDADLEMPLEANIRELNADLEMQEAREEKVQTGREEKREEEREIDYIDSFEETVSSAALRAVAIASSAGEAVKILSQESFNTLKNFVPVKVDGIPLPAGIRPRVAARRVARDIVPILRRNRAFQGLGIAAIMALIVPVMMTLLDSFNYPSAGEETSTSETAQDLHREPIREGRPAGTTKEGDKVVDPNEIDTPQGQPLLRPSFKQLGTEYIDKTLNTPMRVQNSEWAEFDFAPFDKQNHIKIDNVFGADLRFREPMFMPHYQRPLKPPTNQARVAMSDNMIPAIQLRQRFVPKFDASITRYDDLSKVQPNDPFARSWEDNILYYPI